ncbi:MAG TPA: hypothetical protein VFN15_00110 [Solirubrobacterales bacterium]|nr:hypothetical protein [Solirubrobacterales bacterium]
MTVAILPSGTEPEQLGEVAGISPGAMSAGLAEVSAVQTYLDIGAGNRVFTSLYDFEPPVVTRVGGRVPGWDEFVRRAESAPADIVPGLLASTLEEQGMDVWADPLLTSPALIAANREGRVRRTKPLECLDRRCPGLAVVPSTVGELRGLVGRLRSDDLLIAIERPPPPRRESLAIGIAGAGFDGNLTSDTTRTDGFVAATDVAPTVLERFSLDTPDEMSGRPIRSEGEPDAAAVADRTDRMKVVSGRRSPAILDNLMIWLGLALAVALLSRGRWAGTAFSLGGLATAYLPTLLLVGAAVQPSLLGERLIVGLGAPALAALTLLLARGWLALAIACAVTVGAYALDVIAGSPLSARSLLGPNPGLGVRFFGIGNELEATLAVLITVGVGAALAAARQLGRPPSPRAAIVAFLVTGGAFAVVFAAGRFGADVGAAIVFPAAAAMAALAVPGALARRRLVLLVVGAPVLGLALLALLDLVLGGDAHLSRSVLEAGGRDELADVFERRLRLSASSFGRATAQTLFWVVLAAIALVIWQRRRVLSWFAGEPLARAGFAGAAGAVLLGTVANDSGATFLIIGSIALLGCLAFAYGRQADSVPDRTN